jgi:hypothetical protein
MYDVFLYMNGSDSLLIVAPVSYMMELLTIEAAHIKLAYTTLFLNMSLFLNFQLIIYLSIYL